MIEEIIKEIKPKMQSAIEKFKIELSKIRTGRANPEILDDVAVTYYGSKVTMKEVATISVPEPNQISIKPWDRSAIGDIESAIRNSDLGLSPINDGQSVRLVLPPMTEERRKDLANQIKKLGEESKIALRNVRKEAWDKVQDAQKKGEATEDDKYRAEERLNVLINEMNAEVDKLIAQKEQEVMKI